DVEVLPHADEPLGIVQPGSEGDGLVALDDDNAAIAVLAELTDDADVDALVRADRDRFGVLQTSHDRFQWCTLAGERRAGGAGAWQQDEKNELTERGEIPHRHGQVFLGPVGETRSLCSGMWRGEATPLARYIRMDITVGNESSNGFERYGRRE